jgi:hypothetical protein
MNRNSNIALGGIAIAFLALAAAFVFDLWGHPATTPSIPLVDKKFVDTSPSRVSIAEFLRKGGDASDYECNICHEKNKPIKIKFDVDNNIILPKEHLDIVLGHGTHKRNNNCYNCHDESNLELLQTRDGRQLKLVDSTPLCGSCHGPTYRDWEAGVHGRTSGFWDRELGDYSRLGCASCHNPHAPKFPGREPAPGPHALHPIAKAPAHNEAERNHE